MASPARFSPAQADRLVHDLAAKISKTIKLPGPNQVHHLRVMIRRFRQALAILAPCLTPEISKELAGSLKRIMALAGAVRNCDITQALIENIGENVPSLGTLRRQAARKLVRALGVWQDQDAWLAALKPCHQLSDAVLQKMVRQAVERAARRVHRRSDSSFKSLRSLHKLRIALKKLRYALELAGSSSKSIRELQTQLGKINDYRTARALLKKIGGAGHIRASLARKQREKVRRFRREFKEPKPAETLA